MPACLLMMKRLALLTDINHHSRPSSLLQQYSKQHELYDDYDTLSPLHLLPKSRLHGLQAIDYYYFLPGSHSFFFVYSVLMEGLLMICISFLYFPSSLDTEKLPRT